MNIKNAFHAYRIAQKLPETMTIEQTISALHNFANAYVDLHCINIDDVVADVEASGGRYILISGGMVASAIAQHGYPADAKYTFRAFDKQTGWMRIIPYHYCVENFLFDAHRGRRGFSAVYPVIMIGSSADYLAIKQRHDHVYQQFWKDVYEYRANLHNEMPHITRWAQYTRQVLNAKYQEYLRSQAWIAKKWLVFKRDGYQCQHCGTAKNIQCHHLTYDHLYDEPLDDLVTLCKQCHESAHSFDRRKA